MVEEVAKATEGFEKADAELTAMKNQPTVEAQLGAMILKRNMKSKRAEQSCIRISHHLLVLWFCPPALLSLRQSPSLSQSPPHSPPHTLPRHSLLSLLLRSIRLTITELSAHRLPLYPQSVT